ncbi:MAG: 30S ribosomal protein S8, small subunit ribosomal protein S8 [Candidatus Peregrinibacteria bacterium GW2011_GWC2_39_14]|nr:MAG: 30S ribosomal protein S8 [Candidatus Peregrinibacteria bacterium GW2011_GWA2_38_36]KKR06850.1 MAG: 30S ribosomal protein S8, small subunit ribosomal protein S8 [Candidatus Peregrinibacteria bacterium GW2011_GWC2_39_14]
MHTDPIADLLIRIKNAMKARHSTVNVPYSKIKENMANIIAKHGFVEKVEKISDKQFPELKITLKEGAHELSVKRVSKLGQRIYVGKDEIKKVKSGFGIAIISTSKGVMTGEEARKLNIGGELLCEIR